MWPVFKMSFLRVGLSRPLSRLIQMPRFRLKALMCLVGLFAIAMPLVIRFWPCDIMAMPPQSVLGKLDVRFQRLDRTMDFDDAFSTLGLSQYKLFLTGRAMESGGMSGMRTSYDLGTEGYSLEMVTYLDGRTACILWTPNSFNNREAELANSEPMLGP